MEETKPVRKASDCLFQRALKLRKSLLFEVFEKGEEARGFGGPAFLEAGLNGLNMALLVPQNRAQGNRKAGNLLQQLIKIPIQPKRSFLNNPSGEQVIEKGYGFQRFCRLKALDLRAPPGLETGKALSGAPGLAEGGLAPRTGKKPAP